MRGEKTTMSMYKIQRFLGGEWVDWSAAIFPDVKSADIWIFNTIDQAEQGDSAKDLNRWRSVEVGRPKSQAHITEGD